ncbi:MAG: tRNA epoxyqueuosine(34) reductase QueG [Arenicellales bacterium]
MHNPTLTNSKAEALLTQIKSWAKELGFADIGVSNLDLSEAESRLHAWLLNGFHGSMDYMQRHGTKRTEPDKLIPGTVSILSLRMDYLPESQSQAIDVLSEPNTAYISRYALGRDYHKLIRKRLKQLALKIQSEIDEVEYRVFTDSAPVMEKPIAHKAGLGWMGKHSNILNREAGSWFFLGEIYLNFALPETSARKNHCGGCTACIDVCPTQAIIAPYVVDARKCISYLTIENHDDIPLALRPLIGNRIYGCDDCQLFCPWNRFATLTGETAFHPNSLIKDKPLTELFAWDEATFLKQLEGSPIRRIGYQNWLRNIAVALGNAKGNTKQNAENLAALSSRKDHADARVAEHIHWAIEQQLNNS